MNLLKVGTLIMDFSRLSMNTKLKLNNINIDVCDIFSEDRIEALLSSKERNLFITSAVHTC